MSKKLFGKIFILLLVVGLLFAATQTVQAQGPTTRTVCAEGCDFTTIQAAIDGADAGDTITVAAGIYHVPTTITLDKAISIIGPTTGEAKVIGTGTDMFKVFAITSSNVTIKDLEITLAVTPANLLISDELNSSLISISGGAGMTGIIIQGNEIYVPVQTPPMTGWTARALTVGSNTVSGMVISGNTVYNTRNGIVIQGNNSATITGNTIYNTKGGIMNYTGTAEDAAARVMTNNSWGTVHNEWDIVWNSGGGPYDLDENVLVLGISQSNNDAYVVSLMPTAYTTPPQLLNSNRSHVFVNATTGTETLHNANGNINVPYKKIQDGINAVVPGGKVIVGAGTYAEDVLIDKSLTILGPNSDISPVTGERQPEAVVTSFRTQYSEAQTGVTIKGFEVTGQVTSTGTLAGIYVGNTQNVTIEHNYIHDVESHGIAHFDTPITNLNILDNKLINTGVGNNSGVYLGFLTDAVISANLIDTTAYGGILLTADSTGVDVVGNTISNTAGVGIQISSGLGDIDVSGNIISNAGNGLNEADKGGIRIYGSGLTGLVSVYDNTISGSQNGIGIKNSTSCDLSYLDIYHNSIATTNEVQVYNGCTDSSLLDVTPNWWGSATGPAAGQLVGDVSYLPYCTDLGCTEFSQAKLSMDYSSAGTTDTCSSTQLHTVDVFVQDVAYLTAYSLEVGFNPALVEVTAVANGGWLDPDQGLESPGKLIDNVNGKVVFGWAAVGSGDGESEPVSGAGALIKITFKAKGLAGLPQFTVNATNSSLIGWEPGNEGMPIPFEVSAGESFNFGSVVTNTTKSPTVSYCDLDTAVSAATSGDTLRADVDFTVPTGIAVQKALTLNTNRKTITYSNPNNAMLMVYGAGDLTVTGGGVLNASDATPLSLMSFSSLTMPKITLADATISGGFRSVSIQGAMYHKPYTTPSPVLFTMTGGTTTDGIYIHGLGAELIVSGGTVTCTGDVYACPAPIYGSPSQYSEGTKVTISDTANVISPANIGPAIYQPQDGQLFVTGGTISGLNAINMEAGNLTVSGTPTITGTGGDAILMNGNIEPYYPSDLTANISGGIITSTGGYALHETALATTRTSEIAISGGKFTGSAGAVQFTTVDPAILKLTDGAYNTDPGAAPDYVFAPLDTYLNTTDGYYYIEEVLMGRIDELPGFAAANDLILSGDGTFVGFLGEIPWYPADPDVGRTQANRVAVKISEPTGGYNAAVATMTIGTKTWIWHDIRTTEGWVDVWQKIISVPQTVTVTMKWNNVSTQTLLINILEGSTLELPPAPVITSTDIQGYYLAGEAREFNVKLEMPADGANYALMIFDYKLAGVTTADITKFEFFAQDLGKWIDMGSRSYETYGDCTDGPGVCGQFGWAPGGFGPIAAGFTNTTQFRVTFAKGFAAPLSFTLDLSGKLVATDNWTKLTTYTGSLNVYDKPTITFQLLENYFLTGDPQNFQVTFDNPITGGTYGHVVSQISIPAAEGDITSLKYLGTALTLDCTTTSGVCTTTFDFGVTGGIPLAPSQGAPWTLELTAAKAGTYPMTFTLVDLDSNPDRSLQSATGTATVYNKPVITAPLLSGPFTAGVPADVVVNVDNVSVMFTPNTFELFLDLPEGTVVTYGASPDTQTVTCGASGCDPIVVTLIAGDNALPITVTFPGSYDAPISVGLWDRDVTRITALATYTTPANVVVNGDFTVTGNFSMQGNLSRADVPVNFDWTGTLVDYDVDGTSSADSGTNLSVLLTYGGNYTITTLQPRYLNVYAGAGFSKMINLTGDRLLPELRLRGGNAYWRVVDESNNYTDQYDNTVNGSDASVVGTDWGPNSSSDLTINHGDVNFDGKVNIQDLALVGGNFGLTSADAYEAWLQ